MKGSGRIGVESSRYEEAAERVGVQLIWCLYDPLDLNLTLLVAWEGLRSSRRTLLHVDSTLRYSADGVHGACANSLL